MPVLNRSDIGRRVSAVRSIVLIRHSILERQAHQQRADLVGAASPAPGLLRFFTSL
jgi:hypothetical protein